MNVFSLNLRRKFLAKAALVVALLLIVGAIILLPANHAFASSECYYGSSYSLEWNNGAWHHAVNFAVGSKNNGYPNWRVYTPGGWIWGYLSYSVWGFKNGLLQVGFNWPWKLAVPIPANTWMVCKA